MESSPAPAPAPLPQSYDDRAVLRLEPLRDAFIARELGQRRLNKTQECEWVAGIAKDVRGDESAAEVARRWLRAISASGKRAFWNFVLPLDDETSQLFVRFFWLIYTEDLSAAKSLLASSRRNWGLESYLYEFTVSKRLESVDGPTFSSTGVPNWVPYPGGAKSSNTLKSLVRKRSILRSTSFPISMAVQSSLKKKRGLNGKIRRTLRRTNSVNERVRAHKNVDSSVEVASDRGRIARGNKRKLGHDDARSHRRPGGITAVLRLRPGSGKRPTEKTNIQKSERPQRVSETPVEYDGSLKRLKRHRCSKEEPNERDPAAREPIPIRLPGRKRGHGQTPNPFTRPELNASPSNVTGAAMDTSSTSKTRRPVVAPYTTAGDALGYELDILSNSIPNSATTWPESCPTSTTECASERASVTTKYARKQPSPPDVLSSRSVAESQTSTEITGTGAIAELDRDIGSMACGYHVGGDVSALVYTFEGVAEETPEDEDDPHGVTPSEYRDSSLIGLEKEPAINLSYKPRLSVRPPIWAQSRQEVCESLDAFRSFQGGVYQFNDIVKGYLLGAHSSSRDLFHHGGRLIISHGGGKAEALHSKHGRLEIQGPEDQLEDDRSVRALLNNYRTGRPLVLLADNNYVLFPFDLTGGGYTYVVLGLYWIAHAWAELQQVDENHSVVRYKFAFQWCEGQGDPWWTQCTGATPTVTQAKNSQLRDSEPGVTLPEEQENLTDGQDDPQTSQPEKSAYCCPCCRSTSPLVYQDTPMCLQPSCAEFWRVDSGDPAAHNTLCAAPRQQILSYSTELLRLRPPNHIPVSAESLYPPLPDASSTTPRPFAKGIHCRHCGRLSTRFKWEHFECSHCHRIYEAPPISFSHKDFWLQEQTLKFYQHRVAEDSGIVIRGMEFRSRMNGSALPYVQTFDLPYNRGSVHLIPGHPSINGRANDLFRKYQKQAATGEIQFRRWPLRAHKCRGQLLSNYFSQNTGAPYQYIGGAERTTPLEDGAEAVLGALDLIRHRIATALGTNVNFNEVLSAAYMEKQKMAFHSDSERGLGPVVASLSLGSVAEMHFRLHTKYTITEGHRKVAMSLVLRHGDVLVMEGAGVQEYYEHAVVPKNFRIVATARFISPENYET